MSKFTSKDWIEFEIFVADFIERYKPKDEEECEKFSQHLHEYAETAIQDYIMDSDSLSEDEYQPYC